MKSQVLHSVWCKYVWWGCRGNLMLIALGSERVNRPLRDRSRVFTLNDASDAHKKITRKDLGTSQLTSNLVPRVYLPPRPAPPGETLGTRLEVWAREQNGGLEGVTSFRQFSSFPARQRSSATNSANRPKGEYELYSDGFFRARMSLPGHGVYSAPCASIIFIRGHVALECFLQQGFTWLASRTTRIPMKDQIL